MRVLTREAFRHTVSEAVILSLTSDNPRIDVDRAIGTATAEQAFARICSPNLLREAVYSLQVGETDQDLRLPRGTSQTGPGIQAGRLAVIKNAGTDAIEMTSLLTVLQEVAYSLAAPRISELVRMVSKVPVTLSVPKETEHVKSLL